mgnify:FL=1
MTSDVLLIDGLCALCTNTGKFISKRQVMELDIIEQNSEIGLEILSKYQVEIDSLVLIRNSKKYTRSAAAIRCLLYMRWNWRMLYPIAWIVPFPVRDLLYILVSRFRK